VVAAGAPPGNAPAGGRSLQPACLLLPPPRIGIGPPPLDRRAHRSRLARIARARGYADQPGADSSARV
jgi:hypothetical protein